MTMCRYPRRDHPGRDDRGIAVVFFAISVTAMLAVGALVLGGSVGYTASRNAQTAADSAALAGATALNKHKQNWSETSADQIVNEIEDVVNSNGAELAPGGCELIRGTYGLANDESEVIGPCSILATLDETWFRNAAGVRVTVSETRAVPFSAFVERDDITARAVAAATIQPVVAGEGRSVFMICSSPDAIGHPAQVLREDPDHRTGYSVRDSARGKVYVLWGNEIKTHGQGRDCGNNSSDWRGLIQWYANFAVPSPSTTSDAEWWRVEEGNNVGRDIDMAANVLEEDACELSNEGVEDLELGCRLAVPLCPFSNKVLPASVRSADFRLYCPQMGVFTITHIGSVVDPNLNAGALEYETPCGTRESNIVCGEFVGSATARDAQGSAEAPEQHDYVVVKLVE